MKNKESYVCPVEKAGLLDSKLRRWLAKPVKTLAPFVHRGMTVLDMGCGPGMFTLEIAKLLAGSGKVIAADLQQGMLDIVAAKFQNSVDEHRIVLHKCEADRIGLAEQVDFALCFYMVHEVPDQGALFAELATIVKPGGKLLIVEPKFHVTKPQFAAMIEKLKINGWSIESAKTTFSSRTVVAVR